MDFGQIQSKGGEGRGWKMRQLKQKECHMEQELQIDWNIAIVMSCKRMKVASRDVHIEVKKSS